jgi:hypothetical protein
MASEKTCNMCTRDYSEFYCDHHGVILCEEHRTSLDHKYCNVLTIEEFCADFRLKVTGIEKAIDRKQEEVLDKMAEVDISTASTIVSEYDGHI